VSKNGIEVSYAGNTAVVENDSKEIKISLMTIKQLKQKTNLFVSKINILINN